MAREHSCSLRPSVTPVSTAAGDGIRGGSASIHLEDIPAGVEEEEVGQDIGTLSAFFL